MYKIDLHTHTCVSDGNQSPLRTLVRAYNENIDILSITDHNTINQYLLLEKQIKNCKNSNKEKINKILSKTKIIRGIELTCSYKNNFLDILGYNFDRKKMQRNLVALTRKLANKNEVLRKGFLQIINKYNLKFDTSLLYTQPVLSVAFFNELKNHKENNFICHNIYTLKQFLQHINNPSSPFYINLSITLPNIHDTISCIHKSGGIAFIAHVGRYSTRIKYELDNIIACGIDGIEVWYPMHNTKLQNYLLSKVIKHNLKASGGSDNHYISEKGNCFGLGCMNIPHISQTQWIIDGIKGK